MENLLKVGDIWRHKASGQKVTITEVSPGEGFVSYMSTDNFKSWTFTIDKFLQNFKIDFFQEDIKQGTKMTREEVLNKAKETVCGDREQAHGNPKGTFERIAKVWSAYLNQDIKASDVAIMMILFKTARLKGNPKHEDSWIDIAGYAACGCEIAESED